MGKSEVDAVFVDAVPAPTYATGVEKSEVDAVAMVAVPAPTCAASEGKSEIDAVVVGAVPAPAWAAGVEKSEVDVVVAGEMTAATCAAGAEEVDDVAVPLEAGADASTSCAATGEGAPAATRCAEGDVAKIAPTAWGPAVATPHGKHGHSNASRGGVRR